MFARHSGMEIAQINEDDYVHRLARNLRNILSPVDSIRKNGEQFIINASDTENFATVTSQIVGCTDFDEDTQLAAASIFRNFVKRNWPIKVSVRHIIL